MYTNKFFEEPSFNMKFFIRKNAECDVDEAIPSNKPIIIMEINADNSALFTFKWNKRKNFNTFISNHEY